MNDQEIHMLGLQALIPWLEGHNYVVDYVQPEKCAVPHVFALSGKVLTVVTEADKAAALKVANELHALCAVASIGLVNDDGVAANDKELMGKPLKNGQYKADFSGLEYIQFEN